ncbi:hypothetical protein ES332_D04G129100v1, partial [Gossypium tomentosum]
PTNGSIYVSNLPKGTDESMLAEYFGSIGLLKISELVNLMYGYKVTNELKGDATVTYEDPHAALAAVEWFNDKDFHESTIGVFMAESKSCNAGVDVPTTAVDGGGFEDDATKDMDGVVEGEGDWLCPNTSCSNINFSFHGASCGRGAGGCGRGRGAPYYAGHGRAVAVIGGLFGPNDWPCPMCGNINWAKRMKCNICNTNKPGHNEGGVRY